MLFVTVLSIEPKKNKEAYEALKELKAPERVRIINAFGLFGEYDAILTYNAQDEKAGMDFLLELCKLEGVVDTRTFAAVQLR